MGAVLFGDQASQKASQKVSKPVGIVVTHKFKRSGMALIPLPHKPLYLDSVKPCPNCQIIHTDSFSRPVKTVHLWLDDTGSALVSVGVLEDLKKAGLPNLSIGGHVSNPPGIRLGDNRSEVDHKNRTIRRWKEP